MGLCGLGGLAMTVYQQYAVLFIVVLVYFYVLTHWLKRGESVLLSSAVAWASSWTFGVSLVLLVVLIERGGE